MEYLPISADQGITDDSIGSSPLSQPILTTHKVPEQTLKVKQEQEILEHRFAKHRRNIGKIIKDLERVQEETGGADFIDRLLKNLPTLIDRKGPLSFERQYYHPMVIADEAVGLIRLAWKHAGRKRVGFKSVNSPVIRVLAWVMEQCTGTPPHSLEALAEDVKRRTRNRKMHRNGV